MDVRPFCQCSRAYFGPTPVVQPLFTVDAQPVASTSPCFAFETELGGGPLLCLGCAFTCAQAPRRGASSHSDPLKFVPTTRPTICECGASDLQDMMDDAAATLSAAAHSTSPTAPVPSVPAPLGVLAEALRGQRALRLRRAGQPVMLRASAPTRAPSAGAARTVTFGDSAGGGGLACLRRMGVRIGHDLDADQALVPPSDAAAPATASTETASAAAAAAGALSPARNTLLRLWLAAQTAVLAHGPASAEAAAALKTVTAAAARAFDPAAEGLWSRWYRLLSPLPAPVFPSAVALASESAPAPEAAQELPGAQVLPVVAESAEITGTPAAAAAAAAGDASATEPASPRSATAASASAASALKPAQADMDPDARALLRAILRGGSTADMVKGLKAFNISTANKAAVADKAAAAASGLAASGAVAPVTVSSGRNSAVEAMRTFPGFGGPAHCGYVTHTAFAAAIAAAAPPATAAVTAAVVCDLGADSGAAAAARTVRVADSPDCAAAARTLCIELFATLAQRLYAVATQGLQRPRQRRARAWADSVYATAAAAADAAAAKASSGADGSVANGTVVFGSGGSDGDATGANLSLAAAAAECFAVLSERARRLQAAEAASATVDTPAAAPVSKAAAPARFFELTVSRTGDDCGSGSDGLTAVPVIIVDATPPARAGSRRGCADRLLTVTLPPARVAGDAAPAAQDGHSVISDGRGGEGVQRLLRVEVPPRPENLGRTLAVAESYARASRMVVYEDCGGCPCCRPPAAGAAAGAGAEPALSPAQGVVAGCRQAVHEAARRAMPLRRLRADATVAVRAALGLSALPEAMPGEESESHGGGWVPESLLRDAAASAASSGAVASATDVAGEFELQLTRALLRWFKTEHFTWVNAAPCVNCGAGDTQHAGVVQPNAWEAARYASRTELYSCQHCTGVETRFPRFNDPLHILVNSRRGRCGEWAQGFLLACRAAGLVARFVMATTDHVWTEVWSRQRLQWLHADSCEDSLDAPLLYERGWGRKLEHIYAVSAAGVADVVPRYTRDEPAVQRRRLAATCVGEAWHEAAVAELDRELAHGDWERRVAERAHARENAGALLQPAGVRSEAAGPQYSAAAVVWRLGSYAPGAGLPSGGAPVLAESNAACFAAAGAAATAVLPGDWAADAAHGHFNSEFTDPVEEQELVSVARPAIVAAAASAGTDEEISSAAGRESRLTFLHPALPPDDAAKTTDGGASTPLHPLSDSSAPCRAAAHFYAPDPLWRGTNALDSGAVALRARADRAPPAATAAAGVTEVRERAEPLVLSGRDWELLLPAARALLAAAAAAAAAGSWQQALRTAMAAHVETPVLVAGPGADVVDSELSAALRAVALLLATAPRATVAPVEAALRAGRAAVLRARCFQAPYMAPGAGFHTGGEVAAAAEAGAAAVEAAVTALVLHALGSGGVVDAPLCAAAVPAASGDEARGRVSGDVQWRESRGEMGK